MESVQRGEFDELFRNTVEVSREKDAAFTEA
jgi:hypothetical protein